MKVNLRKGLKKDIGAALALVKELALFEKAPGEVEVSIKEMQASGFGKEKIFDFFVLEKNGRIIGTAIYYYKYSTWKGRCLFLEDIIVTQNERNQGYGKLLFEAVAKVAKEQNMKRLEWQVLDWNSNAIAFYKKYKAQFDAGWINCKLVDEQLQSM